MILHGQFEKKNYSSRRQGFNIGPPKALEDTQTLGPKMHLKNSQVAHKCYFHLKSHPIMWVDRPSCIPKFLSYKLDL
jgi:hypothetical protein